MNSTTNQTFVFPDAFIRGNSTAMKSPFFAFGLLCALTVLPLSAQVITTVGTTVGIGTTTPDAGAKLQVAGGILTSASFASTTGGTAGIDYNSGGLRLFGVGTSGTTKGTFTWIAKGADGSSNVPMYIDSAGNVGIGTTNPGAALDVIRPGNANVFENGVRANRPDAQGQYAFMGYGQSSADAYFGSVYTGGSGIYGRIHFRQYTVGMTARDAVNIDSSGNVGIGTTSPFGALHLYGSNPDLALQSNAGTSDRWRFRANNDNQRFSLVNDTSGYGEVVSILRNGNVGIGTTSPGQKLDVAGNFQVNVGNPQIPFISVINTTSTVLPNAGWDYKQLEFKQQDGGVVWEMGWHSGGLGFRVNNGASQPLFLAQGGNVGIGTASPSSKMHVLGTWAGRGQLRLEDTGTGPTGLSFNQNGTYQGWMLYGNNAGTNALEIQNYSNGSAGSILLNPQYGGNVGIGTGNPTSKLTVNGNVKAKSFTADSSNWADFVFQPDYQLASLPEVEAHIRAKGHLPDIPSAAEVKARGVDLGEMEAKLLQKVEELTLHLIRMEKENTRLRQRVDQLESAAETP